MQGDVQSRSRKIVFFFPLFASPDTTALDGILKVSTFLHKAVLVDSTITPNYRKRLLREVRDVLSRGISLVVGPMIRKGVEIAKAIKDWNALPSELFIEEAVALRCRYSLDTLWFVNNNFPADPDRTKAISEASVRAGSHYKWVVSQCSLATLSMEPLNAR